MKLTEQCCTLQQSKRLQELGVTAKSECLHVVGCDFAGILKNEVIFRFDETHGLTLVGDVGQAYTVAELARPMAEWMDRKDKDGSALDDIIEKYVSEEEHNDFNVMYNPQFLADCLIHLLENNLLTPAEVNEAINK